MFRIGRDPFARHTVIRRSEDGTCRWCGGRNRHGRVFRYGVEDDMGRVGWIEGGFCAIGCCRAFHNFD
jgi:hypothetical protein